MILLVDDLRVFKPEVSKEANIPIHIVRTSEEAIAWLETFIKISEDPVIEQLWLDHDLGMIPDRNKPGGFIEDEATTFVKNLLQYIENGHKVKINQILVHTSNPQGAENMMHDLSPHYSNIVRVNASDYLLYED